MQSSYLMLLPFLLLALGMANAALMPPANPLLTKNSSPNMLQFVGNNKLASATCYDPKMASIINNAVKAYSHNMGQLSNYILNQIKIARFSGYWFVHSEMIGRQTAQVEWNSVATGDIFSPASRHGCYYHDGQTYIVVLQY